ncbi:hypothetical protein D623_10021624 [Myotis brandtii]|uniref:Uncharacterized protein n=1 Tax=Myotis brandtii TaxID=109478 RepID=S7NRX6_MYOBR|nr:hypothetical protein D623_10021624 [Myotis brandtii]
MPVGKALRVSCQFLVGWQKGSARTQLWEAWLLEPQTRDLKPPKIGHLSRGDGPSWPTSPKAMPNPRDWGAENLWALGAQQVKELEEAARTTPSLGPEFQMLPREGFTTKES